MLTTAQREQFARDGYVIIENAVELHLLEPLRAATHRATERTRAGGWPHKRAAGDDDVWGVSHLLHPELGEPIFAEYMASAPVLGVAEALIGSDLVLALVNMLVNPARRDFAIAWHRDRIRKELPPEEEEVALAAHRPGVQWNTALYDENCLLVVPGSHRRIATPEERDVLFERPMDPMPNEKVVELQAGQGVYYNALMFHRGVYRRDQRRETLHACLVSATRQDLIPGYYSSLKWMDAPGFRELLPPRLQPLYDRWFACSAEFREQGEGV